MTEYIYDQAGKTREQEDSSSSDLPYEVETSGEPHLLSRPEPGVVAEGLGKLPPPQLLPNQPLAPQPPVTGWDAVSPGDLAEPQRITRSAPAEPVMGELVSYVLPDGTDTQARVIAEHGLTPALLVQLARDGTATVTRAQYALVEYGRTPGCWHEAEAR